MKYDDGGRADFGPEFDERGDNSPYVQDAIGVRVRRECGPDADHAADFPRFAGDKERRTA